MIHVCSSLHVFSIEVVAQDLSTVIYPFYYVIYRLFYWSEIYLMRIQMMAVVTFPVQKKRTIANFMQPKKTNNSHENNVSHFYLLLIKFNTSNTMFEI